MLKIVVGEHEESSIPLFSSLRAVPRRNSRGSRDKLIVRLQTASVQQTVGKVGNECSILTSLVCSCH